MAWTAVNPQPPRLNTSNMKTHSTITDSSLWGFHPLSVYKDVSYHWSFTSQIKERLRIRSLSWWSQGTVFTFSTALQQVTPVLCTTSFKDRKRCLLTQLSSEWRVLRMGCSSALTQRTFHISPWIYLMCPSDKNPRESVWNSGGRDFLLIQGATLLLAAMPHSV